MAKVKEQLEYQMQFQSLALHLRVVQMCCWHVFTTVLQVLHVSSTYLDLQMLQKVQCRASRSRKNVPAKDHDLLAWIEQDYSGFKLTRLSQTTLDRLPDPSLCQPWNPCIISSAHSHMLPSCLLCQLWLFKIYS